jgi:hypothetical protein
MSETKSPANMYSLKLFAGAPAMISRFKERTTTEIERE